MGGGQAGDRNVGLIGLGLLGTALAERLMQAGCSVWGFDLSAQAMHQFSQLGGQPVAAVRDVPTAAQQIILCLPNSDVVEDVLVKIIPHLHAGTIIIDTTTGDPGRTRLTAGNLLSAGIELVDASVLGSSDVTRRGEAVLLVGASQAGMAGSQSVLETISDAVYHIGPVGSGQQMKLVANLVLGLNRAVLAEGLHFAGALGLDLSVVLDVLKSGAAYSRVMDAKGHRMIDQDFVPQARLSQHLKDVNLILDLAENAGTQLPLSEVHRLLLKRVEAAGDGDLDNSAVIRAW